MPSQAACRTLPVAARQLASTPPLQIPCYEHCREAASDETTAASDDDPRQTGDWRCGFDVHVFQSDPVAPTASDNQSARPAWQFKLMRVNFPGIETGPVKSQRRFPPFGFVAENFGKAGAFWPWS